MGNKGDHRRGGGNRDGYGRGSRPAHKRSGSSGGGICGLIVFGALGTLLAAGYGAIEAVRAVL